MEELVAQAWTVRQANFEPVIEMVRPHKTAVVSVTGPRCSLNCAHCGGHYVKKMIPLGEKISPKSTSLLISGGCDKGGRVPLVENLKFLLEIKENKKTNLHAGLVEDEEIPALAQLADVVSFDFVGDDETIKEVYHLDKTVKDYVRVYENMRQHVKVLPHICIGLKGGIISGEYRALEILKSLGADGLVFIIFNPTPNTAYAGRVPPPIEEVVRIIATARINFPDIPIHLGCMRPGGSYRTRVDVAAVNCGINVLVQPAPGALIRAEKLGLKIIWAEECCVL